MTANDREKRIYRVTLAGSGVNAFLLIAKFAAGIIGHSAAMIADAVHSLSDFLTDIVVIVFVRLSSKPEDSDHEYGHGKYETLATSIIGLALLAIGAMIGWNGITKIVYVLRGGSLAQPGLIALIAALVSIALKEWTFRFTRKAAEDVGSKALEANAWHHRSDSLSSVGTAIGIGGALLLGSRWAVLDQVAALVVSVFIVFTAIKIVRQSSGELLEESLPEEVEEKIKAIVYEESDVSDIHHLRTRRLGGRIVMAMHLRMPGEITLEEAHKHASRIENRLKDEFGKDTIITIHVEPVKKGKDS